MLVNHENLHEMYGLLQLQTLFIQRAKEILQLMAHGGQILSELPSDEN